MATQDPVLRAKFTGTPEHIINYFFFVAEELREIMARLGFRTVQEMIGQVGRLDVEDAVEHWKARDVDLSRVLHAVPVGSPKGLWNSQRQDHGLGKALDNDLIAAAASASGGGDPVRIERPVRNLNRTVGGMLSGEVARRYGHEGLPDGAIHIS